MENKPKKRLSWIVVLCVVTTLCASAFFLARGIVDRQMPVIRSAIALPARPGQNIQPMGGGVLYYDGATLHALGSNGRQTWNHTAGSNADYAVGFEGVAVWADTLLSLLDSKGTTIYSENLEKKILSARLSNLYVAVQIGTEHNSEMMILERGGREIESIDLPDQTVLDYGFFAGGSLFWVMTLNTEGTVPMCSVNTYKPGRMLTGSISDSQQTIYQVLFQSSQVRAVGTDYIKSYDYYSKEKIEDRNLVYGWYLMNLEEKVDNPLMAFVPIAQSNAIPNISDVRMIRGKQEQTIRLPIACFRLLVKGDAVYCFSNQYVFIARMGDEKPAAYVLPVHAESVLGMTDGGSAIVTSGDVVYLVPMPR